ncbi:MAG: excinuclease ABC subunit UvrC [Candidatus Aminicenantes bacterium]|nr:excinuclease ABC subunit UvrC [Candidatus Aminicenantes bacterium]
MIKKSNRDIPEKPGVYLFKSKKKILYIGKAGNLKKRVSQYFRKTGNIIIDTLLDQAEEIEFIVTDNETDALHLEYNLIHTYRPPFNVKLKDDKSFPFIEITTGHPSPGIYFSRNVAEKNVHVGPITNSKKTKDLIDIVTRIFKLRTCPDNVFNRAAPCLYYYIDRCSAPCSKKGKISSEEYGKNTADAIDFLKGKKERVLEKLNRKMNQYAAELRFEEAQKIKEDIELIEKFAVESYISSVRKADYDVTALHYDDRNDCFIILFSIAAGRVKRKEFFNFTALSSQKEEILKDFLISFYRKENIPPEILVPFLPVDKESIEELFSRLKNRKIKIRIPTRGDRRKMFDLIHKNLNLYINRSRFDVVGQRVKDELKLRSFPGEIEGFDISHFSERERVGAVVTFSQGKPVKRYYRSYIIKEAESGDIAALKEVLERRFKKKETYPDLLVIDGGKAQLNAALEIKAKLKIDPDIVAIAKREERIYLETGGSLIFPRGSAERFLFQNIRDEAHRRAITHHKKRREKI